MRSSEDLAKVRKYDFGMKNKWAKFKISLNNIQRPLTWAEKVNDKFVPSWGLWHDWGNERNRGVSMLKGVIEGYWIAISKNLKKYTKKRMLDNKHYGKRKAQKY